MKNIVVVAPHPDDETLGCGGTLLKHLSNGHQVSWLIVTTVEPNTFWSDEQLAIREEEISEVGAKYGFTQTIKLGFPAAKLDTVPVGDIVSSVSKAFKAIQPDVIYIPHSGDIHSDHSAVTTACISASKNFRLPCVKEIYAYETLSETEFGLDGVQQPFLANYFVDVSEQFHKKLEIMKMYKSEIASPPFPRSEEIMEAQGTLRGSRIGVRYAEAFRLLLGIS